MAQTSASNSDASAHGGAPSAGSAVPAASPGGRNVRWTLLGVMLAMLLGMLDNTIVGTSMPTIVRDLGGASHLSWVVSAYTLATAASTPIWGKVGDLFNRKTVFLVSIVDFLVGSALSGTARNMTELIGFRAIQGLGAGGIAVSAFALIGVLVPPRERGRYQGMLASLMAVGVVAGPLLGGVLTGHVGWRWAFYINLPVGILALAWSAVVLTVPKPAARSGKAVIDWPGIVTMTVAITTLVLGATWAGTTYPWASWQMLTCAAVFVIFLAAFIARERRTREPLLPLEMFAVKNFSLASFMIFAAGVALFGATLYLPLYQQSVQNASATSSGLLLLPLMLPVPAASTIAGKIMSKTGRYKVFAVIGAGCLTAGMALMATMGVDTSRTVTSIYMLIAGTGLGFLMQMPNTIAQNSVEMRDMGAASAAMALFRTIGGSLGVAVFGSLLDSALKHTQAAGPGIHNYDAGVALGIQHIFLVGAIVGGLALLAAVLVTEVPLRSGRGPAAKPDTTTTTPASTPAKA